MSACMASSQPPPKQKPLTAAIIGFLNAVTRFQYSTRGSLRTPTALSEAISFTSAPAANALAEPVITTAPIWLSFSAICSCSTSSSSSLVLSAFSASGRCNVIVSTPFEGALTLRFVGEFMHCPVVIAYIFMEHFLFSLECSFLLA